MSDRNPLLTPAGTGDNVGKILFNYITIENSTRKVAEESAQVYNETDGDERVAGIAAVREGKERGVEVYGWQVEGTKITVWTRAIADDTWVVGPIYKAITKQDFEEQFTAKYKHSESFK